MFFSALKRFSAPARKGDDLARTFHRCFNTADGQIVLEHLHHLVMFRPTEPALPEAQLRFLEGQRQLLLLICQTIAKANAHSTVNQP